MVIKLDHCAATDRLWPRVSPRQIYQKRASRAGNTIELPSSLWESVMKTEQTREAWNKGKLIGQKSPLKPKDVWAIRIHLQNAHAVRDLALFNLAIDSKLRGCDLVSLRVRDVTHRNQVLPRALIVQRKTQRPVQFELTEPTRSAVSAWLEKAALRPEQYLFPSRLSASPHLSTRQYARMIHRWAGAAGLGPTVYGTHSMRRYLPFRTISCQLAMFCFSGQIGET
jgi:integrase